MKITLCLCFVSLVFLAGCGTPSTGPVSQGQNTIQADGITPKLSPSTTPTLSNLEKINSIVEPSIHQPVVISAAEELTASGWAVDQSAQSEASGVEIVIDGKAYRAKTGIERMDVANYLKVPAYSRAGFSFSAPADAFGRGKHQLSLRVIAKDGKSYFETPAVAINVE
ncbi:MAG: hypothetical protein NTW28_27640 [Candidatus Solibacter sp.]|nr:hypothetical protein [Candidatus Solibacter sp.]